MASGLSLSLRYTKRTKKSEPLPPGPSRDRTLNGKARIRARKIENKLSREALKA